MRVLFDKNGCRLGDISFDQMNFRYMAKKSVLIINFYQALQLLVGIGFQIPRVGLGVLVFVRLSQGWESGKGIKSINPSGQIFGLKHRAKFRPRHQTESTEHPALHDRSLDRQNFLKKLVHCQESLEVLPARVFGKAVEFGLGRVLAAFKDSRDRRADSLFGGGFKCFQGLWVGGDGKLPR